MSSSRPSKVLRLFGALRWLIVGAVLVPAVATAAVGIVILALWDAGADIALGVLTICFGAFALVGTASTLLVLARQQRLTQLQTDFIANVSHELRTPLSSIRMYVETLRLGRVRSEEQRQQCLAALEKETTRLSDLVEQLLELRDAPELPVAAGERVDAEAVAREVVACLPLDQRPRVSLVVEPVLPSVLATVSGTQDALGNLVRNALSHGGQGPVVVNVRADALGVAFHVRDSGPGIARRDQKRVFTRFERTASDDVAGLGLGLAIVREFAERFRGRVSLDSEVGRGSTFTLWLPSPNVSRDKAADGVQLDLYKS